MTQSLPHATYRHAVATVGGIRVHYVIGGAGPPVVLLHGFPQTWYAWRKVMPGLAAGRTVLAIDLRGAGLSGKPHGGYDKATMAEDVRGLLAQLGLGPAAIVGHDIGGMVAYACAAMFPDACSSLALLDVPVPGTREWDEVARDPRAWHVAFHMQRDTPEMLLRDRELPYISAFILDRAADPGAFSGEDLKVYADALALPGNTRGAMEWYRALPQDAERNRALMQRKLALPTLALGGDGRWGALMPVMMRSLADHVAGGPVRACGHWIAEEQPQALLGELQRFLG